MVVVVVKVLIFCMKWGDFGFWGFVVGFFWLGILYLDVVLGFIEFGSFFRY